MDWTECNLVESVPDKVSGVPVVKGTRIFADTIPENYELGMSVEEIQQSYPSLALEDIRELIQYQLNRQPQFQQ